MRGQEGAGCYGGRLTGLVMQASKKSRRSSPRSLAFRSWNRGIGVGVGVEVGGRGRRGRRQR